MLELSPAKFTYGQHVDDLYESLAYGHDASGTEWGGVALDPSTIPNHELPGPMYACDQSYTTQTQAIQRHLNRTLHNTIHVNIYTDLSGRATPSSSLLQLSHATAFKIECLTAFSDPAEASYAIKGTQVPLDTIDGRVSLYHCEHITRSHATSS